jgi:SAM-dependent methyltransferase
MGAYDRAMNHSREDVERANALLRPGADAIAEAWRTLVEAEKAQVEALPNRPSPEDFYAPIATAFRADPRRTDEPLLNLLRPLVQPDETWLDLGAGGGRYTLPVALLAQRVYAIEPSAGMREQLLASAQEEGIENLDVFDERWPGPSEAPVADVGFMSQVGYDIAEIGPFLDQLEAHTKRLCVVVMYERSPLTDFAPLWQAVHGEARVRLPALHELLALLFAKGRDPRIDGLQLHAPVWPDTDALHRSSRRPLWVLQDTPEDESLGRAVRELAVPVEGVVSLVPRPRFLAVVTWEPS